MTTVSSSTSTLASLASLYASENATSGATTAGGLTSDQASGLVGLAEGDATSSASGLDALLGQTGTTSATDLTSILDEIAAQKAGASASPSEATSGTATTQQQKAASLMQSVYRSEQSNLFTLLG